MRRLEEGFSIMNLVLGTAQFGFDYGVSNDLGHVSEKGVSEILKIAKANGICTLDTAIDYGNCESILGKLGLLNWKVVTKLPPLPGDCIDPFAWIQGQTKLSIKRLGVPKLHGLLLHRPTQLLSAVGPDLYKAMQEIKAQNLVTKIGISVYSTSELDLIFHKYPVDIVQAPLNIIDRSLIESGWANRLRLSGVEVHTRSAFLQGLLLMPNENRPYKFNRWSAIWSEWSRWLSATGLTPLQACIQYVNMFNEIDHIVVGTASADQLVEIISCLGGKLSSLPSFDKLLDDRLIDPSSWGYL